MKYQGLCSLRHPYITTIAIVVVFAVLTIGFGNGGISGNSIREWDRIIPDRTEDYVGWTIGASRAIRTDEWAVSIPFVMAQCAAKEFFPRVNPRINQGMDMFVQTPCPPVLDWTVFGQFHNWGYFLFGFDHGLAWAWWTRYLLLPFFAWLFLLRWCFGDRLISIVGAFAVTLGGPTQWWDTTIPYMLSYMFAALVFLERVLHAKNVFAVVASGFGAFVAISSFFLVMYPPFTMLLLPLFATLSCCFVKSPEREHRGLRIMVVLLAVVGVLAELGCFFAFHKDTLQIIAGSSYPGARFETGGSFLRLCDRTLTDWMSLWAAFVPPHPRLNHSSASGYIGLFIPLTAGVAWLVYHRGLRKCGLCVVSIFYAAVLLAWVACRWPHCLARFTGFYAILPNRASTIEGLVVLVAGLRYSSLVRKYKISLPRYLIVAVLLTYLLCRSVALWYSADTMEYFFGTTASSFRFSSALFLTTLVSIALISGFRRLFAIALLVFSMITGMCVHPLSEGIAPLRDKVLVHTIIALDRETPGRWFSNDRFLAQIPVALGLDAYSGTQVYCDRRFWEVVDPEEAYIDSWNRYANRYVRDFNGTENICIKGNALQFSLDETKVRALGIRYLLLKNDETQKPSWLRLRFAVGNVGIYEIVQCTSDEDGEN